MDKQIMIHEERASGTRIDDGKTVIVFDLEQDQYNNEVQQNYQESNSTALVAISENKEKSLKAVCSSNPRKRCKFDIDFEEIPDSSTWQYTCPFGNCRFNNYVFGFKSKAERNQHMEECVFRDNKVHLHVSTDGQMPSAQLIDKLVDGFSEPNLKEILRRLFLKSAGQSSPGCSSLNNVSTPPTSPMPLNTTHILKQGKVTDQYPGEASGAPKKRSFTKLGASGQFLGEYYPIQDSLSGGYLSAEKFPNNKSGTLRNNWITNNNYHGILGGHGLDTTGKGLLQISNGNSSSSCGGLAGQFGTKYYAACYSNVLENNNNVVTSSYGLLPDMGYSTLLDGNWTVNTYEELGKLSFEDHSSESGGGGAFVTYNELVSSDSRNEHFHEIHGSQSSAAIDDFENLNSQGKVCEAVNNNSQFQGEASTQECFQLDVIDEFLNEKSYLMDDDICLE